MERGLWVAPLFKASIGLDDTDQGSRFSLTVKPIYGSFLVRQSLRRAK